MKTADLPFDIVPMESLPPGTVMLISACRHPTPLQGHDGVQEDGSVIVSLNTPLGEMRVRARAQLFKLGT